jgi:ribosomal protein L15E
LQFRLGVTVLGYWEIQDAAEKRYKEFLKKRDHNAPKRAVNYQGIPSTQSAQFRLGVEFS